MTQIPVVLGLTALVAVPTAVGIHFLSASKTTQTQEVPEQNQPQQEEVARPKVEDTTYDFSDVDVEATDLVGGRNWNTKSSFSRIAAGRQSRFRLSSTYVKTTWTSNTYYRFNGCHRNAIRQHRT